MSAGSTESRTSTHFETGPVCRVAVDDAAAGETSDTAVPAASAASADSWVVWRKSWVSSKVTGTWWPVVLAWTRSSVGAEGSGGCQEHSRTGSSYTSRSLGASRARWDLTEPAVWSGRVERRGCRSGGRHGIRSSCKSLVAGCWPVRTAGFGRGTATSGGRRTRGGGSLTWADAGYTCGCGGAGCPVRSMGWSPRRFRSPGPGRASGMANQLVSRTV